MNPASDEADANPPVLVNIGDLLSFWTRGLFRSTLHRVVFPAGEEVEKGMGRDRFSMAYFCHPGDGVGLVGVPSWMVRAREGEGELGEGGGEGEGVLTAREHLNRRLAATYGLNDEESSS